jgi:hypothetical protein
VFFETSASNHQSLHPHVGDLIHVDLQPQPAVQWTEPEDASHNDPVLRRTSASMDPDGSVHALFEVVGTGRSEVAAGYAGQVCHDEPGEYATCAPPPWWVEIYA